MPLSVCPGCGLKLEAAETGLDERYNASRACRRLYDELSAFTLSIGDKDFIRQLVVDTYAAQHSGPQVKPISTAFALIGLYLTYEKGYSGRAVQRAHLALGNKHLAWPRLSPPQAQAVLTVRDVVQSPAECRLDMLRKWGRSVWDTWRAEHERVRRLVETHL